MSTVEPEICYCPYCGEKNSITNKYCAACGADISNLVSGDNPEAAWHVEKETYVDELDIIATSEPRNNSKIYLLIAAGAICIALLVTGFALGRIFVKGNNAVVDSAEANGAEADEAAANSTEGQGGSDAGDGAVYTAPSLRLTLFGGETSGNELIVHSPVFDNFHNEYQDGLGGRNTGVENCTEYFIGDQYKYFSFRIVLNYERRTDYHEDTCVYVYADGSQIYKSKNVGNGFEPVDETLDVSGVEKLKIGICGLGDIRVVDPVLHNDDGYEQYSTMKPFTNYQDASSVPLSYLEYWNGSSAEGGLEYIRGIISDTSGQMYDGVFAGTHNDQDNWVEYDITDCGFKKLKGTIFMNPDPDGVDKTSPVVVISENEWHKELYRSTPVQKGTNVQHFEVSLENTTRLRVQIGGKYNVRLAECYISK